jgi:hypothetical protein
LFAAAPIALAVFPTVEFRTAELSGIGRSSACGGKEGEFVLTSIMAVLVDRFERVERCTAITPAAFTR